MSENHNGLCKNIRHNCIVPSRYSLAYSNGPSMLLRCGLYSANQKHFNQFTMSLLFCVILFYIISFVSAAASVGTEQMSTGHLVVFASLRSVQSGHPPMSCTLVFALIRVRKHWWDCVVMEKK